MRTLKYILVCSWALTPMAVWGQANESLAVQAEQAFQEGVANRLKPLQARQSFARAADSYRDLHDDGCRSPALYLNLGNAAVLADRWPEALWAYHVGLKLDPNDSRLRENRDFVRAKVLYPSAGQGRPRPDLWPAWIYRPSCTWLAVIALSTYALAWLAGTGAFLWHRPRMVKAAALAALVAIFSGVGLWHELGQADMDRETPLVIIQENTLFYRGNGLSYPPHPDLTSLPRGMEARQQHRRGGWMQIRLSTGEIGWVPCERVLSVEP